MLLRSHWAKIMAAGLTNNLRNYITTTTTHFSKKQIVTIRVVPTHKQLRNQSRRLGMIKIGLQHLSFFQRCTYFYLHEDFKLAAVKDYNKQQIKIMIAAMKNCKKKTQPNKMTTQSRKERKERKSEISLYRSKLQDCYIILQNQIGAEFFICCTVPLTLAT